MMHKTKGGISTDRGQTPEKEIIERYPAMIDCYLGVYALLDRLHVVTDTLSQSLPDTELRGELCKLDTTTYCNC